VGRSGEPRKDGVTGGDQRARGGTPRLPALARPVASAGSVAVPGAVGQHRPREGSGYRGRGVACRLSPGSAAGQMANLFARLELGDVNQVFHLVWREQACSDTFPAPCVSWRVDNTCSWNRSFSPRTRGQLRKLPADSR